MSEGKKLSKEMIKNLATEILWLHEDKRVNNNPNDLILVCDKDGHCDSYYQANELFFWEGKNENEYIEITNNSEGSFWDDDEVPTGKELVEKHFDILRHYIDMILEHIEE